MTDSFFTTLSESAGARRYLAGPHTAGPWADHLQHGGPPNALAVAAAESAVALETGRTDLVAMRLSADFVGPVPVGEIETRARVVRAARSAALVEVMVSGADRDCLHVRVWFIRRSDTAAVAARPSPPPALPEAPSDLGFHFPYVDSLEWRFVYGAFTTPGPAAAWVRPAVPLVGGYELSGLARAVLIADSASGISAELDWSRWSFVNVDLDVHLARPFEGEWVFMDAASQLGSYGCALTRSTLSDLRGRVGGGMQTLVLTELRPAD